MHLKILHDYLSGILDPKELNNYLTEEVNNYSERLSIKGASSPVLLKEEGLSFILELTHLKRLCQDFVDGIIDKIQLEYIANLLKCQLQLLKIV